MKSPLDPQVAEMFRLQATAGAERDAIRADNIQRVREQSDSARRRFWPQIGLPVESIVDDTVPGPGGDIPVRVVRPKSEAAKSPTVLYFHGGAFALGGLDSHEGQTRRIANRTGAVVINVGYRLAPEHRFPAAIDDAIATYEWAVENIGKFGGDSNRIGVAGDSAGGNIALVVATILAERNLPLAAQLLAYPVTDWTQANHGTVVQTYFGEDAMELRNHPHASPLRSDFLKSMAPWVLGVGEHDFLYGENCAFVEKVNSLEVYGRSFFYPSLPHGFLGMAEISEVCQNAADEMILAFRELLLR